MIARQLDLALVIPRTVPLVKLTTAQDVLGEDEDSILRLVESGALPFAFDLARTGAARREIRIWRECLLVELQRRSGGPSDPRDAGSTLRSALDASKMLPPGHCHFVSARLAEAWSVSDTHIHNLIADGALRLVPGQTLKAKQSPLLVRASAAEFLKGRRV